jgi:hypothetical protein
MKEIDFIADDESEANAVDKFLATANESVRWISTF